MATSPAVGGHTGGDVPQVSQSAWQIPDWLSPARLIALSAPVYRLVALTGGVEREICPPNPRRVGLVVIVPNADTLTTTVAPRPATAVNGIAFARGSNAITVSLSDWQSLCCAAWVALCSDNTTVQVIEMVRTL